MIMHITQKKPPEIRPQLRSGLGAQNLFISCFIISKRRADCSLLSSITTAERCRFTLTQKNPTELTLHECSVSSVGFLRGVG